VEINAVDAGVDGIEHGARDPIPAEVFAKMKARGTTYDPTLVVLDAFQSLSMGRMDPLDRSLVRQVAPPGLIDATKRKLATDEMKQMRDAGRSMPMSPAVRNLIAAWHAGVMLVTGTDSGNPMLIHGPAVHRELQLWVAAGIPPVSYQWLSNGIPVPVETRPMLALDNITADQAGDYSVVLSNATGTITSPTAALTVSSNVVSPALNVPFPPTSDGFGFTLDGQIGGYYRVESSTDLANWLPEVSFTFSQPFTHDSLGSSKFTSVVYNTNSLISLVVPQNTASKFVRASVYVAPNEICNNNLKQIQFAKQLWARNTFVARYSLPMRTDLSPYLPTNFSFYSSCPSGGYYSIDTYRTPPTCSVPGHVLEESR